MVKPYFGAIGTRVPLACRTNAKRWIFEIVAKTYFSLRLRRFISKSLFVFPTKFWLCLGFDGNEKDSRGVSDLSDSLANETCLKHPTGCLICLIYTWLSHILGQNETHVSAVSYL